MVPVQISGQVVTTEIVGVGIAQLAQFREFRPTLVDNLIRIDQRCFAALGFHPVLVIHIMSPCAVALVRTCCSASLFMALVLSDRTLVQMKKLPKMASDEAQTAARIRNKVKVIFHRLLRRSSTCADTHVSLTEVGHFARRLVSGSPE